MIELVGNHLWQSTLVAAAAALLTLAVRDSRAQVRYGLWLAASAKFLVPFAVLTAFGGQFGRRPAAAFVPPDSTPLPSVRFVVDAIGQPFSRSEGGAELSVEVLLSGGDRGDGAPGSIKVPTARKPRRRPPSASSQF